MEKKNTECFYIPLFAFLYDMRNNLQNRLFGDFPEQIKNMRMAQINKLMKIKQNAKTQIIKR